MIHRLWKRPFNDDRNETIWLTIYADLITNLMLLFLALYGLAIMGDDAMAKALQSMKFGEIKIQSHIGTKLEFNEIIPVVKDVFKEFPDINVIDEAGLARIQFGEKALFESGEADLKPSGVTALLGLASVLVAIPYTVVVEGHTDNIQLMGGGRYKDNRELALARAMSVVRLLVDQGVLPTEQLAAAAYGEYKPRSSNLTSNGRQMNRRVEVLLSKDFPYEKIDSSERTN